MQASSKVAKVIALADAPGSGATVTVWDSGATADLGDSIVRITLAIDSSADSAANGVTFETTFDGGTTWRAFKTAAYTTASGLSLVHAARTGSRVRIRYANSAAVLTYFRGEVRLHADLGNL